MDFFENAIEILELLIKALNGQNKVDFVYCGNDKTKFITACAVFKPP